jgi:hypothetical protein
MPTHDFSAELEVLAAAARRTGYAKAKGDVHGILTLATNLSGTTEDAIDFIREQLGKLEYTPSPATQEDR